MGQDLNETELPESELGEQARRIKQAIDEKRIIQTFQSIIPLLSTNENESGDFYYVSLQMLNKDGAINGAGDILAAAADSPALRKHIDRWMLREIIGRIINGTGEHLFLLHISRDSLADPSLFNWLRTLLSGLDQIRPGSRIALEIDAADFAALQKPAGALMTYLQKNQGFRFVLGGIDEYNDAAATASRARFSFMRLNHSLINEATAEEASTVSTKDPNIQIIADNIEDAMSLTAAIAAGAEYAMGPFISEPAEQIDDHTNIESFEIV